LSLSLSPPLVASQHDQPKSKSLCDRIGPAGRIEFLRNGGSMEFGGMNRAEFSEGWLAGILRSNRHDFKLMYAVSG